MKIKGIILAKKPLCLARFVPPGSLWTQHWGCGKPKCKASFVMLCKGHCSSNFLWHDIIEFIGIKCWLKMAISSARQGSFHKKGKADGWLFLVLKGMCLDEVQISAGQEANPIAVPAGSTRAQGPDTLVLPTPQVRPVQPLIHNAWFSSAWKLPFRGDGGKQLWSQIPSAMLLFHVHGFLGAVGYIWLDSTPPGWHCF